MKKIVIENLKGLSAKKIKDPQVERIKKLRKAHAKKR
jgi:hypothetical protein